MRHVSIIVPEPVRRVLGINETDEQFSRRESTKPVKYFENLLKLVHKPNDSNMTIYSDRMKQIIQMKISFIILFQVTEGLEDTIVFHLGQNKRKLEDGNILSAFSLPFVNPGIVFIESKTMEMESKCYSMILDIDEKAKKLKVINIEEIIQQFCNPTQLLCVRPKKDIFVKILDPENYNEAAQLIDTDFKNSKVLLKFFPKIDYPKLKLVGMSERSQRLLNRNNGPNYFRLSSYFDPTFFYDKDEIDDHRCKISLSSNIEISAISWDNNMYVGSLQYKWFPVSQITTLIRLKKSFKRAFKLNDVFEDIPIDANRFDVKIDESKLLYGKVKGEFNELELSSSSSDEDETTIQLTQNIPSSQARSHKIVNEDMKPIVSRRKLDSSKPINFETQAVYSSIQFDYFNHFVKKNYPIETTKLDKIIEERIANHKETNSPSSSPLVDHDEDNESTTLKVTSNSTPSSSGNMHDESLDSDEQGFIILQDNVTQTSNGISYQLNLNPFQQMFIASIASYKRDIRIQSYPVIRSTYRIYDMIQTRNQKIGVIVKTSGTRSLISTTDNKLEHVTDEEISGLIPDSYEMVDEFNFRICAGSQVFYRGKKAVVRHITKEYVLLSITTNRTFHWASLKEIHSVHSTQKALYCERILDLVEPNEEYIITSSDDQGFYGINKKNETKVFRFSDQADTWDFNSNQNM